MIVNFLSNKDVFSKLNLIKAKLVVYYVLNYIDYNLRDFITF